MKKKIQFLLVIYDNVRLLQMWATVHNAKSFKSGGRDGFSEQLQQNTWNSNQFHFTLFTNIIYNSCTRTSIMFRHLSLSLSLSLRYLSLLFSARSSFFPGSLCDPWELLPQIELTSGTWFIRGRPAWCHGQLAVTVRVCTTNTVSSLSTDAQQTQATDAQRSTTGTCSQLVSEYERNVTMTDDAAADEEAVFSFCRS